MASCSAFLRVILIVGTTSTLQLCVDLLHCPTVVLQLPRDATTDMLYTAIRQKLGDVDSVSDVSLMFAGKVLRLGLRLTEFGLQSNSRVEQLGGLRGGMEQTNTAVAGHMIPRKAEAAGIRRSGGQHPGDVGPTASDNSRVDELVELRGGMEAEHATIADTNVGTDEIDANIITDGGQKQQQKKQEQQQAKTLDMCHVAADSANLVVRQEDSDPNKTAQICVAKVPSTTQREPLLCNHAFDPVKQAEGIRVLVPGKAHRLVEIEPQQWLTHYGVFGSESEIVGLIRQTDSGLLPDGTEPVLYIHNSSLQHLTHRAYEPLGAALRWGSNPEVYKSRKDKLPGCKVRVLDERKDAAVVEHVEMRGVPLHEVEKFHATYKGATSRLKQGRLLMPYMLVGTNGEEEFVNLKADHLEQVFTKRKLNCEVDYEVVLYPTFEGKTKTVLGKDLLDNPAQCIDGCSWVAWAAADTAGPPDLMISYSWDLNWDYLIAYLKHHFGPDVRLWIDILACAQHPIERGNMSEISCLPEVISFTGKTLVMPGTVKRMWCLYEFAWSIHLNGGGCLFYAGFGQEAAMGLSEAARIQLRDLVKGDDASLRTGNPTSMLENANCFKEKDGEFIQNTINDRLGGKRQVSMIIRHQFRSLTGEGAGASNDGGGSERDALVSMFLECNGPNWKQRRNWMEDAPLGEWDGVKVLEGGDAVAELQLKANNVAGQFLEIFVVSHGALFANLACMNIEDNNAIGSLPTTHR